MQLSGPKLKNASNEFMKIINEVRGIGESVLVKEFDPRKKTFSRNSKNNKFTHKHSNLMDTVGGKLTLNGTPKSFSDKNKIISVT